MENTKLVISPKTKILQLIEAYPQLEDVLIEKIPTFKKLKNPLLRKTVAKITSIQQAAIIGEIEVGDLVNLLRQEVGQELISMDSINAETKNKPKWFDEHNISQELDVRDMLAAGEHPVNQVIADLQQLKSATIYRLISTFIPAPLIDKASSLSFSHWVVKETEELFSVYFYKE
ncbi:MAG: DUF1858 domain-containing protein [Bacteroidales bacterium]|nr:DUF1858 domain-containing protein [Bacteroidales bacterium]